MIQFMVRRLPQRLLLVSATVTGLVVGAGVTTARAEVVATLRGDYDANGPYTDGQFATGLTDTSGLGTWEFHRSPHRDFVGGRPVVEPLVYFPTAVPIIGNDLFRDATGSPFLGTPSIGAAPLFTVQPGPASDELAVHSANPDYAFPYLWLIWTSGVSDEVHISGWIHNISTDVNPSDGTQLAIFSPSLADPDATIDPLQTINAPGWAETTMDAATNRVMFTGDSLSGIAVEPGSQIFFLVDPLTNWSGDNTGLQIEISTGVPPGVDGDFNGDGNVDGADFVIWQTNFPNNTGTATLGMGDANGDGSVDGADFVVWQTNFPTTAGQAAPVPEPASVALLLMGGGLGLAASWRRRRAS